MANDVFPPHNLNPDSVPWGRSIQDRVRSQGYSLDNLIISSAGDNRAIAGQMGALGRQIEDLTQRRTTATFPADLELIKGGTSGEIGPIARALSIAAPQGGARTATIFGSGSVVWTGTSTGGGIADSVTSGIEVRQSGNRIWFDRVEASSAAMFTFSGSRTFSVVVPVVVPEGGSSWDLRLWVGRTSSGGQANAGVRLSNMNFTVVYGDKV